MCRIDHCSVDPCVIAFGADSILCKSGFIKSYSKPSNPGRAKNFTNPPDYQMYFDHTSSAQNAAQVANITRQVGDSTVSPPKGKVSIMNQTASQIVKDNSLEPSHRRPKSKLLDNSAAVTTRTTK